jgi:hypothetical protein
MTVHCDKCGDGQACPEDLAYHEKFKCDRGEWGDGHVCAGCMDVLKQTELEQPPDAQH